MHIIKVNFSYFISGISKYIKDLAKFASCLKNIEFILSKDTSQLSHGMLLRATIYLNQISN